MDNDLTPPLIEPTPPENKEARTMGMLCHLLALCGLLGVPFGHIIGPLVIWLIKREESPFIDACGKEALNFQISMTLYIIVSALLAFVIIGFILLPAILLINLVLTIIASIKASEGTFYQYPLTIRFIR
jgi:uncharacterized Tic20 family protein